MPMRRALTIPLTLFAFLALPGLAHAGGDGPAAGEEYILDIPGAEGNEPGSPSGTSDTSPDSGSALPSGTEDELLQEGSDGAEAAELARETGPGDGGKSGGGSPDVEPVADADGGSGVGDVVADLASGSDSGMGVFLPILLVLALAGALAFVVWRRRGTGSPGTH
jgi:hypothetical protein